MTCPDERYVLTEIDVQHAGIGPFHQHSLPVSQSEQKKSAIEKERTLSGFKPFDKKQNRRNINNNAGTGIDLSESENRCL
jgi:hypothetical protein